MNQVQASNIATLTYKDLQAIAGIGGLMRKSVEFVVSGSVFFVWFICFDKKKSNAGDAMWIWSDVWSGSKKEDAVCVWLCVCLSITFDSVLLHNIDFEETGPQRNGIENGIEEETVDNIQLIVVW